MIDKQQVIGIAQKWLDTKEGYFLVDVDVTTDNRIVVEIDQAEGVWIDDCVDLSRFIESALDRDVEDYELEVGSAGIGQPFKVLQQYINHIGQEVEVLPKSGAKIKGILTEADEKGFKIRTTRKEKVEGSKRPKTVEVEMPFGHDEVKYVKYVIRETISLIDTFQEFKELKNIDRMTLVSVLEESFRSVISKMFGTDENYSVIVNPDKGDCEIQRSRIVVEDKDLEDSNTQISLTEARQIDEDFEVGEEVSEQVDFSKFGRRAILNLRQTLASKILELEKDSLYNKYVEKIGTIVSGEVYQIWKKEILLLDEEGNELLLAKTDQIPSDFFRKGETVRAVVDRVDNVNNPKIMLSRTSPVFLQRLLEQEVPEIADGLITIKKIVRIPGERAKIAVESYDDRIDPVGACVGVKGSRIHGIVRELRNENIDVINYTTNIELFIKRALSPAKISELNLDTEARRAEVYLKQDQVSLAIGKSGLNIKLASMLTEYTIDVYRELEQEQSEEDIYLDDFRGDIEDWVVDALHDAGFETAKAVLRADREILTESVDLEEEQVDEILDILAREFADEEEFQKFIKK